MDCSYNDNADQYPIRVERELIDYSIREYEVKQAGYGVWKYNWVILLLLFSFRGFESRA